MKFEDPDIIYTVAVCANCKKEVPVTSYEVQVRELVGVRCPHCGHIFKKGEKSKIRLRAMGRITRGKDEEKVGAGAHFRQHHDET